MSAAIVTGAAGAIGAAILGRLVADGRAVVGVDSSEAVVDVCAAIARGGGTSRPCVVDLTAADAPTAVLRVTKPLGGPSILVNNAGITRDARALAMDEHAFRAVVRVNAVATLRLSEAVVERLPDGGAIVNVASRAAFGNFGQANYVAAKSAVIGSTRALALRWAPRVRVNAVAPGLVDTRMTRAMPPRVLDRLVAGIPAGRAADPAEIAEVVAFLASPRASYVTGQVLVACGGRSLVA